MNKGNENLKDLYDRIGFLIRRANQKANSTFQNFSDGITTSQYGALHILMSGDSLDLNHLAKRLHVDRTNVSVIVKSLEKNGFVSCTPSKIDRRQKIVELTPSGKLAYEVIDAKARAAQETLLSEFTDEEAEQFRSFLKRLIDD